MVAIDDEKIHKDDNTVISTNVEQQQCSDIETADNKNPVRNNENKTTNNNDAITTNDTTLDHDHSILVNSNNTIVTDQHDTTTTTTTNLNAEGSVAGVSNVSTTSNNNDKIEDVSIERNDKNINSTTIDQSIIKNSASQQPPASCSTTSTHEVPGAHVNHHLAKLLRFRRSANSSSNSNINPATAAVPTNENQQQPQQQNQYQPIAKNLLAGSGTNQSRKTSSFDDTNVVRGRLNVSVSHQVVEPGTSNSHHSKHNKYNIQKEQQQQQQQQQTELMGANITENPLVSTKTIVTGNGKRGNVAPPSSTSTPDYDSLQQVSDLRNDINNSGTSTGGYFNNQAAYTPSSSRRQHSFRIRQYRLAQPLRHNSIFTKFCHAFGFNPDNDPVDVAYDHGPANEYERTGSLMSGLGIAPHKLITSWLYWSIRQSFFMFFITSVISFWIWTLLFAFLLFIMDDSGCIGGTFSMKDHFTDAYQLSWTTFSTVGYGAVHIGVSPNVEDIRDCTGMTVLITLEAFVGILYGSMCGALLYIKISRIQSFAQVAFSTSIVVRYGSGVALRRNQNDTNITGSQQRQKPEDIPFPILEFRIANRMHDVKDGEIIDCNVNIVASVDPNQSLNVIKGVRKRVRMGHRFVYRMVPTRQDSLSDRPESSNNSIHDHPEEVSRRTFSSHHGDEEDGYTEDKRVFVKVFTESLVHPFFKRVWTLRHVMNAESPLLKPRTRELIMKNDGYWPKELNTYKGVRDAFQFDSLLISFSGTSNADANAVYAQHVYDFHDVNVGYTFRSMFSRSRKGLKVLNMYSLSDIVEQEGGAGEPKLNSPVGGMTVE